ncbi:MAG: hypothetical protein P1S60_10465 [Anaerolineae bacterium]|nr:hypothetical protein [Anaerolineae bacterium]
MSLLNNNFAFAQGASNYSYESLTGRDGSNRIICHININDQVYAPAAVDTGGIYLYCSPGLAEILAFDPQNKINRNPVPLGIGRYEGITYGDLYQVVLTLQAEEGQNITIEVTAYIPTNRNDDDIFALLGFERCLEQIRFAIDPPNLLFYFGSINTT